eukprot:CAMPEP_0180833346 /NCGR_PEP_ID=MMETSP1038_2-20121128/77305_1 /TAXON_ID=632150 /ORGANISM="Azadinium spinosum, Strain 3D9" /LENGTH=50 /DNA_ID=CAMNT_0022876569 /DNA_START=42 /DNA_END=191 /DNA_ORIENTATION=+
MRQQAPPERTELRWCQRWRRPKAVPALRGPWFCVRQQAPPQRSELRWWQR